MTVEKLAKFMVVLVLVMGAAACSSGNDGKDRNVPGTCDPSTSNVYVAGFTDTPIVISSTATQADVVDEQGSISGVYFSVAGSTTNLEVTLLSNDQKSFEQGDEVTVGDDPGFQVEGESGADAYFCLATTGEADVEVLSADTSGAIATLKVARVEFNIECATDSALPQGVTRLSGCFNYLGM